MVVVVYAHPFPDRSRANRTLVTAIADLGGVEVRSLYDRYPDFSIDIEAEQQALQRASAVVWQHPVFWYSAPALLKLWFEKVLAPGWAYGPGGNALEGKRCQWVVTTGGNDRDYRPGGIHGHAFDAFVPVVRQTALFCGMVWLEPLVLHGAQNADAEALAACAAQYRARLVALCDGEDTSHG